MASSFDEISTKDKRRLLVIACGRDCIDHPRERWISLDRLAEQNPDIITDVEDLTPKHFDEINAQKEFDSTSISDD